MPHGDDRPVVTNGVSVGFTPLGVAGGGDWTLISNGAGGGAGGGGDGVGDGDGEGAGDGAGEGAGVGDGVDDGTGAGSSPPHAIRPVPAAAERDSVKNSALRLMAWRDRGSRLEAV
jgi:streptogrisin D